MTAPTRRRPARGLSLALALSVLLVLAACGGNKPAARPTGPIKHYVDMGDSYAAGPGINPQLDACYRSGANYGSLIAQDLNISDFQDVACAGAKTSNLLDPQKDKSGATINDPQLDALSDSTNLVTLGIGLNNSGVSYEALYLCLPQFKLDAQCAAYLAAPDSAVLGQVSEIAKAVKASLKAIRDRAPNARIVLIGYPRSLPEGRDCPTALPLTGKAADRLRLVLKATDDAYADVARQEGVSYLSTYKATGNHDLCSTQPWTNGVTDNSATGNGAALHPRPIFMRAVADMVEAIVKKK